MADIIAIGGGFGSANSYGGYSWGSIERQKTQNYTLVVNDAYHGQTVDSIAVTQQHVLVVANTSHAHTVDSVTVTQQHSLVVNDAGHSLTSDNVWVIYNTSLAIDDALHSVAFDSLTITQQHTLAVDNSLHAHAADNVIIQQQHSIVVNDTTHGLLIDGSLTLNQYLLLNKPDDSRHGLSSSNIILTGNQVIIVDDTRHIFHFDEPGIINWEDLAVYFGSLKPNYTKYGSLTASEIAELKALYSNLVIKNGSLDAVEAELGIHKQQYGKTGELLEAILSSGYIKPVYNTSGELQLNNPESGTVVQNINTYSGSLLANEPLKILMFADGFAWLSEDGLYKITEEYGNKDTLKNVSDKGILKQGNIEYGRL